MWKSEQLLTDDQKYPLPAAANISPKLILQILPEIDIFSGIRFHFLHQLLLLTIGPGCKEIKGVSIDVFQEQNNRFSIGIQGKTTSKSSQFHKWKKVFILQINYNKTKTTAKQKIVSIEKSGLPFFSALIYDGFSHYKYSTL